MLTKNDVIQILTHEQAYLKERFGVQRIAIFGSFGSDTATEDSDVDIYLEFERPIGLRFIQLADYLKGKLGREPDIITPGGLEGIRVKKVRDEIQRNLIDV